MTPAMELHQKKIKAAKKVWKIVRDFSPFDAEEVFEMARPTTPATEEKTEE